MYQHLKIIVPKRVEKHLEALRVDHKELQRSLLIQQGHIFLYFRRFVFLKLPVTKYYVSTDSVIIDTQDENNPNIECKYICW